MNQKYYQLLASQYAEQAYCNETRSCRVSCESDFIAGYQAAMLQLDSKAAFNALNSSCEGGLYPSDWAEWLDRNAK